MIFIIDIAKRNKICRWVAGGVCRGPMCRQ